MAWYKMPIAVGRALDYKLLELRFKFLVPVSTSVLMSALASRIFRLAFGEN